MPWHFMRKAGSEVAGCTGHDRLIIATSMNLARVAFWSKAHGKVSHVLKGSKDGLFIISSMVLVRLHRLRAKEI